MMRSAVSLTFLLVLGSAWFLQVVPEPLILTEENFDLSRVSRLKYRFYYLIQR